VVVGALVGGAAAWTESFLHRELTPASSPTPGRPGLQVRGDGDQVDHHDRHQYYGGLAPGIAFQGERLEVFPGELLVGERRTMSSRGTARWPA
jgi:hypothetical protein